MKRDAASPPTRSRPRKKTAVAAPAPETAIAPAESPSVIIAPAETEPAASKNVGSLEGGLSLAAGVLFLVGALFPRTFKQLILLGIGGALVHRGVTGRCGVYASLGIDTAREPLLKQINEKFIAPSASEAAAS